VKKTRNKFEARIEKEIKKAKVKYGYETAKIGYILSGTYIPDFVIETPTGILFVETKGYLRPEHKRKMVAVKRQHPEKDIRIVFYSPNAKYEKWAIKHGFRYAFESIPKEWFKGL
jgi:Autographiviridae endonuclease I